MKTTYKVRLAATMLFLAVVLSASAQVDQYGRPTVSPERRAFDNLFSQMNDQAKALEEGDQFQEALAIYSEVAEMQEARNIFSSRSKYGMARCLTALGREEEALGAFKRAFMWSSRSGRLTLGDGDGDFIRMSADYAMLLAKRGRAEDAKALYYSALRRFNLGGTYPNYAMEGRRYKEPVPFLVVFDPEPLGIAWEYSPQNLEAALKMLLALTTAQKDLLSQVKALRPDWFYPVMYEEVRYGDRNPGLLAQAEALAKPGLEKQLVATYKVELAEHQAFLDASDLVHVPDRRPMREGNLRRAQMQCLQPDVIRLKSLSTVYPDPD
jgi:tetratricopeptide (TPR) repeat protein